MYMSISGSSLIDIIPWFLSGNPVLKNHLLLIAIFKNSFGKGPSFNVFFSHSIPIISWLSNTPPSSLGP